MEASVRPGANEPFERGVEDVGPWVQRFEGEDRELYARRHDIVAALRVRPGMEVADVGAGTGFFTLLAAEQAGPDGRVYAVDIVPEFLELIARRAREAGLQNVVTALGEERSVPLPPGSVDLAFVCDTYHHFEYPRSILQSLHAALRPGGELVIVDFRRIPGLSSDWAMEHVRAGAAVVTAEVEAEGFDMVDAPQFLESNYFLRFRRRD